MPRGAFTASRHFSFNDTTLGTPNTTQDFKLLAGDQHFQPEATYVNSSSNATEETAGTAVIRGILFGENDSFVSSWTIRTKQPIGLAFRKIWSDGTTARGIKLLSEV